METSEITCNQGRSTQENKNFVTKEIEKEENSAPKKDLKEEGITRGPTTPLDEGGQGVQSRQGDQEVQEGHLGFRIEVVQTMGRQHHEITISIEKYGNLVKVKNKNLRWHFRSCFLYGFARRPRIVITHWLFSWLLCCFCSPQKCHNFPSWKPCPVHQGYHESCGFIHLATFAFISDR